MAEGMYTPRMLRRLINTKLKIYYSIDKRGRSRGNIRIATSDHQFAGRLKMSLGGRLDGSGWMASGHHAAKLLKLFIPFLTDDILIRKAGLYLRGMDNDLRGRDPSHSYSKEQKARRVAIAEEFKNLKYYEQRMKDGDLVGGLLVEVIKPC